VYRGKARQFQLANCGLTGGVPRVVEGYRDVLAAAGLIVVQGRALRARPGIVPLRPRRRDHEQIESVNALFGASRRKRFQLGISSSICSQTTKTMRRKCPQKISENENNSRFIFPIQAPQNRDIFEQTGAEKWFYFFRLPRGRGELFLGIKKARSNPFTTERQGWESVTPEILETRRAQRRVSGGVRD
jgi:hypothetical protein